MPTYKDKERGTWYASFYYTDWQGRRRLKKKRGFLRQKDAKAFEEEFLRTKARSCDMAFGSMVEIYFDDMKGRLKANTLKNKRYLVDAKILPFFRELPLNEITPAHVRKWQSDLLAEGLAPTYIKTINNQISAIFNYAVRYYGLQVNPAAKAGNMGVEERRKMLFWTKEEYLKFADAMMDKPLSYYAFEMLYWTGIREGELLALTSADFDFERQTVSITKSYQRMKGRDVITDPKTPKSNRVVQMPSFLCDEIQDYIKTLYAVQPDDRIFQVTKSYLFREMERGCNETGVKRIKVHGLRHSHISLLIDMGFSALAIADRVGHESIDITYRYAHLFPTRQTEMANKLDMERKEDEACH